MGCRAPIGAGLHSGLRFGTAPCDARTVRASFERLQRRLRIAPPVGLRGVRGEVVAETLHGDIVVANEALADLPAGARLFVLAHELGPVVPGHRDHKVQVYRKWVPGSVTQQRTDGVVQPLGRDASTLARRQAFAADAVGLRAVRPPGRSDQDAVAAFMDLGMRNETATQPGTRKRVAARCGAVRCGTARRRALQAASRMRQPRRNAWARRRSSGRTATGSDTWPSKGRSLNESE